MPKDETLDPLVGGENKQSVGMVISLGKFRLGDFGDLTWNKEHDLACPNNLIGALDVYVVSHHGQDISSLPILVFRLIIFHEWRLMYNEPTASPLATLNSEEIARTGRPVATANMPSMRRAQHPGAVHCQSGTGGTAATGPDEGEQ